MSRGTNEVSESARQRDAKKLTEILSATGETESPLPQSIVGRAFGVGEHYYRPIIIQVRFGSTLFAPRMEDLGIPLGTGAPVQCSGPCGQPFEFRIRSIKYYNSLTVAGIRNAGFR